MIVNVFDFNFLSLVGQLYFPNHYGSVLQPSINGPVVFEIDKRKSSYQGLPQYFREHGENSSLAHHLRGSVGSDYRGEAPKSTTLNKILQFLSVTLFENHPLLPLVTNFSLQNQREPSYKQLNLFNF